MTTLFLVDIIVYSKTLTIDNIILDKLFDNEYRKTVLFFIKLDFCQENSTGNNVRFKTPIIPSQSQYYNKVYLSIHILTEQGFYCFSILLE